MAKPADGTTSKNTVLLIATIGSFFTPFMVSAINIALPPIGREFSMNVVLLSWVATSYNLAAAAFLLPFGRLGDIWGRKKFYTIGMIIYAAASLLASLSGSGIALIAFRALQGIGSALIFGTGVAILISVFPASERGKALGINVTATYLGLSLGPFIGGLLTQHLGWRSIFFVNVPLAFLTIALIFWKLKGEWAEARGESFDLTGSLVFGLSLSVMMYGLTLLPVSLGIWLVLAGALGIFAFIKWEGRISSPVLNIRLFTDNIAFAFSNLAALINYSATFAVSFLLSFYLQYARGMDPQTAGLVLVTMPAVQALFSSPAGRLSDRIEPRIMASAGMGLTTAGLVMLIFLTQTTHTGFILTSLVIIGLGFALFSSPNTNAVMSSVTKRYYGVASATLGTARNVGMMLSLGIATTIFAIFLGRVEISPEYYPLLVKSISVAFIVFTALCLGGIFASLARGKIR